MNAMFNCRSVAAAIYAVERLCLIGISAYHHGENVYLPMRFANDGVVLGIWQSALKYRSY